MEKLIELILSLNEQFNDRIPELNAGGCGIFASVMYKQLKQLSYNPRIVIIDNGNIKEKRKTINDVVNNNKVGGYDKRNTSFSHCCLEISGLFFDGLLTGQNLLDNWSSRRYTQGEYTIEELDIALKIGSWNSRYERRYRNPTLRAVIRNNVKQIYYGN